MTPSIKRTTLRLKSDLYEKVEKEAQKIGVSVNALISMILSKEFKEKEGQYCQ